MGHSMGLTVFWRKTAMMTSSNENFSALLAICAGNSPVPGEFPAQRLVTQSFDVFFDLRLSKRLSKQSWGWGFETPSRSLWHHCNASALIGRHHVSNEEFFAHYTERCRYITVKFFTNPHNRHPIARLWGRYVGCFCERKFWFMFCLCYCSADIYNNMLYWTAL